MVVFILEGWLGWNRAMLLEAESSRCSLYPCGSKWERLLQLTGTPTATSNFSAQAKDHQFVIRFTACTRLEIIQPISPAYLIRLQVTVWGYARHV
jgi:hypothetical protein